MSHVLDLGSRKFWQLVGRRVDLAGEHGWLDAPTSETALVGAGWLHTEAARQRGSLGVEETGAGLLPSMAVLDGPGFDARDVHPDVRDFYEHTASWRLDVWSSWSPLVWPAGELVSRLWGQRVEQLALPMRPLDVAHGMDSHVVPIRDEQGQQVWAAWTRTLRSTGRAAFSGAYSTRRLPGADRASVHVAFPLESGNLQVFLRPSVTEAGGLLLASGRGSFGQDGAYVVVSERRSHAARVPLHETFHVRVDDEGTLRTDHEVRAWAAPALRLHYRHERLS